MCAFRRKIALEVAANPYSRVTEAMQFRAATDTHVPIKIQTVTLDRRCRVRLIVSCRFATGTMSAAARRSLQSREKTSAIGPNYASG